MGLFLLIGLFCVLAVIGFFITGQPFKFAIGGIIFLIAIAFVAIVVIVVWSISSPCTAPFSDHSSTYCINRRSTSSYNQNTSVSYTNNDPFPYYSNQCDTNACPQYEWYDRHNVPMSNRCYPSMTNPCTNEQWIQAIGTTPPSSN